MILTYFWLCLISQSQAVSSAPDMLVISAEQPYTSLEPYLRFDYFEPGPGNDLIVPLPWETLKPLPKTGTSFGFTDRSIQLMLRVYNPSSEPISLALFSAFPQLDHIIFECRQDQQLMWRRYSGDGIPISQRSIAAIPLVEVVTFPPGESEIRVYVQTTSSASIPLFLGSQEAILVQQNWKQLNNGLFYGIAFAVAFFALIFFLVSKQLIYILFTGFALATAGFMACFDGIAFHYWPNALDWQQRSIFVFIALALLFLNFFSRVYLDPWPQGSWVDKISQALAAYFLLLIPFLMILPALTGAKLTAINALFTYAFFCGVASFKAFFRREISAFFYLISFLPLLLLGIATALAGLGLFGNFYELREIGLKLANTIALLMLSLGLGWRIQLLRLREREVERQLLVVNTESKTKSEFLAQMSHELRTPMNAIIGMAEVMSGTRLDENQKKYIDIIQTSSDTLLSVINSVLDYSRLEAKRVELSPEAVCLSDLIQETLKIFKVHHLHLDFKSHIAQDVPEWVELDPHRLRQILINLLGNAAKFTEAGRVTIHCSLIHSEEKDDQLLFEVTDTGIGISKEQQQNLFSPFTQADPTTSRKYGGTGLGLSICKQLVELMGGRIGVTSKLDEGSRFWFKLPCVITEPKVTSATPKATPSEDQQLQVLVVEDNRVNIKVIKALLKREGIEPMVAERGIQAIEMVQEHAFDLVFMDCEMPEMDGFETTMAIRKWENEHKRKPLPIYALTAHALEEHRQRSFAAGMDGHLSKPIQVAELREVINQIQLTKLSLDESLR